MITAAIVIELALKSALVAGGVLLLLRFARTRSAAQRSWLAHLGLLGLVMLPAAVLLLPDWNPLPDELSLAADAPASLDGAATLPVLADAATATEQGGSGGAGGLNAIAPPGTATNPSFIDLPTAGALAVWVYAIPAILLLLTMLVAVLRLGAMHRRANVLVDSAWLSALAQAQRRMGFKHGTALLVSRELRSPVSWGLMRPIILLSDDTVQASGEAEAIIAHELAHVARLDWAKLLLARLACALFWFNPLVWKLAREAHQLREETADDAVLLSEVDDAAYASLLVNAARHDNRALLIAAHGVAPAKDSLRRRITRVLDRDTARGPVGGAWSAICLASLVAVAAPLAAFQPSAARVGADGAALAADPTRNHASEKAPAKWLEKTIERSASAALSGLPFVDGEEKAIVSQEKAAHGRGNDEIENLVAYKALDMSPAYIASIRDAGFRDADMEDLLAAKAVGVTAEFARTLRGWDSSVTLEEVVEAKAVGVVAATFGQMRAIFRDAGVEEVVQLVAVGVSPEYAREMRALFPGADADDVTEMKAVGVTPEFVREMRRQGLSASDSDDVVEARVLSHEMRGNRANRVAIEAVAGSHVRINERGIDIRSAKEGAALAIGPNGLALSLPPEAPPAPPAPPAKPR